MDVCWFVQLALLHYIIETKAEKEVLLSQAKRKDHISLYVDIF